MGEKKEKNVIVMLNTIFRPDYNSLFILMMGICSSTEQETFSSLKLSLRRLSIEFVFIT